LFAALRIAVPACVIPRNPIQNHFIAGECNRGEKRLPLRHFRNSISLTEFAWHHII
jgi:hypothetical protein